jgi:hypothetical protein
MLGLLLLLLLWLYSPLLGLARFLISLILYTADRTPWTRDQPAARPLPTYRINAHSTDIHALSWIRTHDPNVRASEDSSRLRPHARCDRRVGMIQNKIKLLTKSEYPISCIRYLYR